MDSHLLWFEKLLKYEDKIDWYAKVMIEAIMIDI